jgi:hypothetical protein
MAESGKVWQQKKEQQMRAHVNVHASRKTGFVKKVAQNVARSILCEN